MAQPRVVGNEGFGCAASHYAVCFSQAGFHHGVAALRDFDARCFDKLRRAPAERERAFGQGAQRIERGHGLCQAGEGRHKLLQGVEQLLEQKLLAGQGAFLGAEGFVFKGFELGRDEALGVLQSLTARVVGRHFVDLALRDLNVKAVHLIELHAQVGNASALAFAGFKLQQKAVAVVLDGAQLVKVGVVAVADDATIAHQHGGFGQQCAL